MRSRLGSKGTVTNVLGILVDGGRWMSREPGVKNGRLSKGATRVLAGFLALLAAHAQDAHAGPKKVFVLPQSASVLEQKLVLKDQQSSPIEDLVAEYIPAAETLDHWTVMLAVRIFSVKLSPAKATEMKAREIAGRRAQGDVMANSMSFAKGETRLIDFVLSQHPIVEHNVMSFSTLPDGRLVSYQLARRYYQKDPAGEIEDGLRAFMGEIATQRDTYVKEIDRLSKDLLN
jgi:hypothetical protein